MTAKQKPADRAAASGPLVVGLVILLLAGLPLAVWLDMRNLSENILGRQADEIGRVINDMRNFYATDVVGRVLANHQAVPTHNYRDMPGGIPIPATLSIELGKLITARSDAVQLPLRLRLSVQGPRKHDLDAFEPSAIRAARGPEDAGGGSVRLDLRPQYPARGAGHDGRPASTATTRIRTARRRTGRSATCAASRRFPSPSRSPPTSSSFKYLLLYFLLAARSA